MEKMNVSLKNIYKLLVTQDFPVYSESVIAERNRKGQTRLRFWQSMVIDEFRCLPYGQLIWRNAGKRNRYISNLCNRNPAMKFYREYGEEIASQVNPMTLLSQTQKLMSFLADKEYRHDILMRRIGEFIRICREEDNCFSKEIDNQLKECLTLSARFGKYGAQGKLFYAAYLLALLTIYAAAGEAMDDPVLAVLREPANGIEALWEIREKRDEEKKTPVVWLTVHAGSLQDNPLPGRSFFGRDEELYDLKEMAVQGGKCLISGIGGIGKTELLRQLIRSCSEEHTVDCIAVVPYVGNIVESFARAFPGFQRENPEESFHQVIYQLERKVKSGNSVLLLIDDLTCGFSDDPELRQLLNLSCGILITSRRPMLDGFDAYRITNPSVSTGALIFRDNYGKPLGRKDRECLNGMLCNEVLCHPLTLRLMARAARSKNWSVQQLKEYLEENQVDLNWREEEYTVKLSVVYRQLYSYVHVPDENHRLIELFTLLPYGKYTESFLQEMFPGIVGTEEELRSGLAVLSENGWLEEGMSGWTMHPLIAQCLRRKVINEQKLQPMLQGLRQMVPEIQSIWKEDGAETLHRISEIIFYMAELSAGPVSGEWMRDILASVRPVIFRKELAEKKKQVLEQMRRRCREWDETMEACYCRILALWRVMDSEQFEQLYIRQKANLTIPKELFLDVCLYAGCGGAWSYEYAKQAEKWLNEVLSAEATPEQKINAAIYNVHIKRCMHDLEGEQYWARKAMDFMESYPDCSDNLRVKTLLHYAQNCFEFRKYELLPPVFAQLEGAVTDAMPVQQTQLLQLMGGCANANGESELALKYYRDALKLQEEYFGKDKDYYVLLNSVAVAYRRLKRNEEALECLKEVLENAYECNSEGTCAFFHNNISVVYMELKNYEEARYHLLKALPVVRKQGGVALGECLKNIAQLHRAQGNRQEEIQALREACPLLEGAYGPEHPRAKAERDRLNDLIQEIV